MRIKRLLEYADRRLVERWSKKCKTKKFFVEKHKKGNA